jgi:SH3 domain protein
MCATIILCVSSSSLSLSSQESTSLAEPSIEALKSAYISDDLMVFILAGPGKNFRILGSVSAGEEIQLTGLVDNDYQQIIDSKNRTAWLESKYINNTSGLRVIIAELNGQLASLEDNNGKLNEQLNIAETELKKLKEKHQQLTNDLAKATQTLSESLEKLSVQDTDLKKEWFYNGAIVLLIGLLVGVVISRLPVRRKPSMQNWK